MRRSTARGRVFPQFYSTDRRYSRLSVKAIGLYPLMWANGDDQGRLTGDPEEIKFTCCPNIDDITKAEVPQLLEELATHNLILRYDSTKGPTIQMLDWWEVHYKMQWAWPSDYPAANGWKDHLRYKKSAKEVAAINWPVLPENLPENSPENSPENPTSQPGGQAPTDEELAEEISDTLKALPEFRGNLPEHEAVKEALANLGEKRGYTATEEYKTNAGRIDLCWEDSSGQPAAAFEIDAFEPKAKSLQKLEELACPCSFVILRSNPVQFQQHQGICLIGLGRTRAKVLRRAGTSPPHPESEKGNRKGRGRGNSPEDSGEKPSPSPSDFCTDRNKIASELIENFRMQWGIVKAQNPDRIIPREPGGKDLAQLRDLTEELVAAGGCPLDYIRQAFREAAGQETKSKMSVSYVRRILEDWLGIPRNRSP